MAIAAGADISTAWDVANARGDWSFTATQAGGGLQLATDPGGGALIATESGLLLVTEGTTVSNVDLASGDDLETAVLISLFTDQTAQPDDVIPDGSTDPRGWWGDTGEAFPIGSRLWLLGRAKLTQATLNLAQDAIVQALQWLIADGVVAAVTVTTQLLGLSQMGAEILLTQPSGQSVNFKYAFVWGAFR
jgi:phage gp46-like protein